MAKKVTGIVRLQVPAGKANPAPPIGPALGAQGVNIMAFCKQFNAAYADKSFTFILKSPPAAVLLKKAAGLQKGSGTPNKTKVGKVTKAQILEIVKTKAADLNATDPEHAARMIEGTARSMGITVVK